MGEHDSTKESIPDAVAAAAVDRGHVLEHGAALLVAVVDGVLRGLEVKRRRVDAVPGEVRDIMERKVYGEWPMNK